MNSDGTLLTIDKNSFVQKKKETIPNEKNIKDYKFFFWGDYIFRLKVNESILIEKYHLDINRKNHLGWEHFASYAKVPISSNYGSFINSNFQLVIFYKECFRLDVSEIKIVIFDLNGDMKSFLYVNKFYNRNCFDLSMKNLKLI